MNDKTKHNAMEIDIQEVGADYCCGIFKVDHRIFGFAFHPTKRKVWAFDGSPNKFERADFKKRLVERLFKKVICEYFR